MTFVQCLTNFNRCKFVHQQFGNLKYTEMCNKVHENDMRFYLGVHIFTPLIVLHREMGWITVKYRHYLNTLRFRSRMIKLTNTSITRHVFQRDIDLSITNTNDWCSNFKQLLPVVRLSLHDEHLWENNCNDLNEIKSKLFKISFNNFDFISFKS